MNKKSFFGLSVIILLALLPIFQNADIGIINDKDFIGRLTDSGHWVIDEYQIQGSLWSGVATADWCSGSGSEVDPYWIENVTFTCTDGLGYSLQIYDSTDYFVLKNCTFIQGYGNDTNDVAALELINTENGLITNCSFIDNEYCGLYLGTSEEIDVEYCTFNNCSQYGIYIHNSFDNGISNNFIEECSQGIYIHSSSRNMLFFNILTNNGYGFTFQYGHTNTLTVNQIISNNLDGIYMDSSNDVNIISNLLFDNQRYGINIFDTSSNNNIFSNNFTANGQHAIDEVGNNWNVSFTGNYWDNYTDYDVDGDRIGESSMPIDGSGGSIDYLPIWNGLAPLFINDSGTNDWAWAKTQDWCSGSGTKEDPYTISNYFIDCKIGAIDAIRIVNSDVFVKIDNMQFFEVYGAPDIAILKLENVSNLEISNTYNPDTTISGYFTHMTDCHSINVTHANMWILSGHKLVDCENIQISDNNFYSLSISVSLINSSNNFCTNNYFDSSGYGITLEDNSSFNVFKNNTILGTNYGFQLLNGCNNNQILSNNLTDTLHCTIKVETDCNSNIIDRNTIDTNGYNGDTPTDSRAAIELIDNCNFTVISKNIITNNHDNGINMDYNCFNTLIVQNEISNNLNWGIYVRRCKNVTIADNIINDNDDYAVTIYDDSDFCKIISNTFSDVEDYSDTAIRTLNCFSMEINNNKITDYHYYGIELNNCPNSTVSKNHIRNSYTGIDVAGSEFSIISDNTIHEMYWAYLVLGPTSNINVTRNLCRNIGSTSPLQGIYVSNAQNCTFTSNIVINTTHGIRLVNTASSNVFTGNYIKDCADSGVRINDYCDNNTFFQNYFALNGVNTYDNGTTNDWNNSVIGNYYDDYSHYNYYLNGIGKIPYSIDGFSGAIDYLPLSRYIPPIIIDEFTEHNWDWVSQYVWCTGSGLKNDPYVLFRMVIDLEVFGNQLEIRNSDAYVYFYGCTIIDNDDETGVLLSNTRNIAFNYCTIISNSVGVELINCSNILIEDSDVSNCYTGISLISSYNNTIRDTTFSENAIGINLYNSNFNLIEDNDLSNNNQICILEHLSNDNEFTNNLYTPEGPYQLLISVINQSFYTESFEITIFVHDDSNIGISSTVYAIWNSVDVSSEIQSLGNGYYAINLDPIFVDTGELPIELSIYVSKSGYSDYNLSVSIAVNQNYVNVTSFITVVSTVVSTETIIVTLTDNITSVQVTTTQESTTTEEPLVGSSPGFPLLLAILVIPILLGFRRKK